MRQVITRQLTRFSTTVRVRSLKEYAGTLLHEIAHVKSGASDINREFEQQLTSLIGTIVTKMIVEK